MNEWSNVIIFICGIAGIILFGIYILKSDLKFLKPKEKVNDTK